MGARGGPSRKLARATVAGPDRARIARHSSRPGVLSRKPGAGWRNRPCRVPKANERRPWNPRPPHRTPGTDRAVFQTRGARGGGWTQYHQGEHRFGRLQRARQIWNQLRTPLRHDWKAHLDHWDAEL